MHDIQYYQEDNPLTMSMLFRIVAIHDGKKIAAQRYVAHELLASGMPEEYIWDSLRHALQKEVDKYESGKILELQKEANEAYQSFDQVSKQVYQAKISEQLLKESALIKTYYDDVLKSVLKKSLHESGPAFDFIKPPMEPLPPPVDTYKERARSEFEGVELDESLWNDEGDLA